MSATSGQGEVSNLQPNTGENGPAQANQVQENSSQLPSALRPEFTEGVVIRQPRQHSPAYRPSRRSRAPLIGGIGYPAKRRNLAGSVQSACNALQKSRGHAGLRLSIGCGNLSSTFDGGLW